MLLSQAWRLYAADRQIEGFSPHTLKGYAVQANMLIRYLGDIDVGEVTLADLKEYLAEQQAVIATEKAREASDSAAAALASEQAAKGSEDWARTYAEDAEEFAEDAEEQAQIAANSILNGVDTHNQSTAAHADIRDDIRTVDAIARGKMNSYVFDAYEDMMEAVQNPEFVEQLKVGDNLYIRDVGVKDYWWDGAAPSELEAEAPDLTNYYTKAQVNAMMPITIEQADYEDLVVNGQVEAGRTYFIIEGDEE